MNSKMCITILCLCGILLILYSCQGIIDPTAITPNTLTFSARLDRTSYIIVAQCDDPSKWEIISDPSEFAAEPVFSPNKKYITYLNSLSGTNDNHSVVLYDLELKTRKSWIESTDKLGHSYLLAGTTTIWDLDSKGFYVNKYLTTIGHAHVDLSTDNISYLLGSPYVATSIEDLKNSETLIVRTTPTSDGYIGLSYMGRDGSYFGKVENQYLQNIGRYENSLRWVGDIDYTPTHDIVVFSFSDTSISGRAIGVTDLAGTYCKVLTEGYSDSNPTYNPINHCVYFEHREWTGSDWKKYPIMKVSVDSKKVNEFFSASQINGAEQVNSPNF